MVRCRPYGNGLLGEAVKEQPAGMGAPAIEAEGEFVEVVVEMPMLHAALMGSHQPSFEQRGNVVNAGHDHVGRIGATADDGELDAGSPTSAGERSRSNRQCGWSIRARRWPERRGSGCPPIRRRRGADGCGQCHDRFSLPPRRQRPCPRSDVRACPLPGRRRKSRRSRSHRRGNRGQGGPSPGAVYAARSRPSRSCPDRAPAGGPAH